MAIFNSELLVRLPGRVVESCRIPATQRRDGLQHGGRDETLILSRGEPRQAFRLATGDQGDLVHLERNGKWMKVAQMATKAVAVPTRRFQQESKFGHVWTLWPLQCSFKSMVKSYFFHLQICSSSDGQPGLSENLPRSLENIPMIYIYISRVNKSTTWMLLKICQKRWILVAKKRAVVDLLELGCSIRDSHITSNNS